MKVRGVILRTGKPIENMDLNTRKVIEKMVRSLHLIENAKFGDVKYVVSLKDRDPRSFGFSFSDVRKNQFKINMGKGKGTKIFSLEELRGYLKGTSG